MKYKTHNRKAVSPIIAYVLLIGIVIAISAAVGSWLYTQAKSPGFAVDKCEGVSISIEKVECEADSLSSGYNIKYTVKNRGRFTIDKLSVKVDFGGGLGDPYKYSLDEVGDLNLKPLVDENEYTNTKNFRSIINRIKVTPWLVKGNEELLCSDNSVEVVVEC